MRLAFDEILSPIGTVVLVASAGRLCALDYEDCRDRLTNWLVHRYTTVIEVPTPNPFGFSSAVRDYFSGDLCALDTIPIDPGGTEFQRAVWQGLRRIPPGCTSTYGALAARLGWPAAARAVGAANAGNPLSIVIPCHRLIGKNGSLTGYAGGLARKRWLLAHEGATMAALRDHRPAPRSSPHAKLAEI